MTDERFRAKYGPWALVAGGSQGIGLAFSRELARRGLSLILVARNKERLERSAGELRRRHSVQVRTIAVDLATPAAMRKIGQVADELSIGFAVYNAGIAPTGGFLSHPPGARSAWGRGACGLSGRGEYRRTRRGSTDVCHRPGVGSGSGRLVRAQETREDGDRNSRPIKSDCLLCGHAHLAAQSSCRRARRVYVKDNERVGKENKIWESKALHSLF